MYRRHSYTTPKSYLELISLYRAMLARKRQELAEAKGRLEAGVDKIAAVSWEGSEGGREGEPVAGSGCGWLLPAQAQELSAPSN